MLYVSSYQHVVALFSCSSITNPLVIAVHTFGCNAAPFVICLSMWFPSFTHSPPYLVPLCSFVLNTTVTAPHEDRITAMFFSPSPETTMLVTTSLDGHFKAWLLADHSDTKGK